MRVRQQRYKKVSLDPPALAPRGASVKKHKTENRVFLLVPYVLFLVHTDPYIFEEPSIEVSPENTIYQP